MHGLRLAQPGAVHGRRGAVGMVPRYSLRGRPLADVEVELLGNRAAVRDVVEHLAGGEAGAGVVVAVDRGAGVVGDEVERAALGELVEAEDATAGEPGAADLARASTWGDGRDDGGA